MSLQNISGQDHDRVYDLLPLWVNNTLEKADQSLVRDHLRTCGACRHEVKFLRSLSSAVSAMGQLDAISNYNSNADVERCLKSVLDRIDSNNRKFINTTDSFPVWSWLLKVIAHYDSFKWGAAAVAGLLAVVMGFKVLTPGINQDYSVLSQSNAPVTPIQLEVLFADRTSTDQARQTIQSAADKLDIAIYLQLKGADRYIVGYNESVDILELSKLVVKLESDASVNKVDIVH